MIDLAADNPPDDIRNTLRRVSRRDRTFFETHPARRDYSRPFVPGEAWPLEVRCRRVLVANIRPGQRVVMALGDQSDAVWPQFDHDLYCAAGREEDALRRIAMFTALALEAAQEGAGNE